MAGHRILKQDDSWHNVLLALCLVYGNLLLPPSACFHAFALQMHSSEDCQETSEDYQESR